MNEKLETALNEISEKHIAEAAFTKKRRRPLVFGAIAAMLALAFLLLIPGTPLGISAKAVSVAKIPTYQWEYREHIYDTAQTLRDFFANSMRITLSGSETDNQAYSPLNLYMALALAAELTGENTRQQILDLLRTDSIHTLHNQTSEIWLGSYRDDGDQCRLANSLWLDKALDYDQNVMDILSTHYYTSVFQGDLDSQKISSAISSWLDQQTGGLLKKQTRQVSLTDETVLALYSTVYFQAKWSEMAEFNARNNTDGIFHSPGGDVDATFMNKKEMQTHYYWGESFGAIALGMKDGSQMWLVLPDEGKTADDVLSCHDFASTILSRRYYEEDSENSNCRYLKVNLSLPKFDIQASCNLKQDLQEMGITDIFDPALSDFTPSIKSDLPLTVLTAVNQATRVAIDEKGVTAASYLELPTAGAAPPPEEIIDFILDRPFLFVITNRYDLPLFAGVVNIP